MLEGSGQNHKQYEERDPHTLYMNKLTRILYMFTGCFFICDPTKLKLNKEHFSELDMHYTVRSTLFSNKQ
jgi:hypothetical protein